MEDKIEIVKYLIQHGANINKGKLYFSPVICAFIHDNENMINYLLKQNVDINWKTVEMAIKHDSEKSLKHFIDFCVSKNMKNYYPY